MHQKFCTQCGSSLPKNARFCGQCGVPIEQPDAPSAVLEEAAPVDTVAVYTPRAPKKKKNHGFITDLITKSLALALAVFTLVMAFMPLVSFPLGEAMEQVGLDEDMLDDADFGLNIFEITTLFFDSFYFLSDEELEESKLYEKLEDSIEGLFSISAEDLDDLSVKDKRAIKSVMLYTLRLSLRSERTVADPAFYIGAICALLYVSFTVAFFVLALLSFLGVFGISRLGSKRLERALYTLLTVLPVAAMITYAALSFGLGQDVGITTALLLPILFSLVLVLWVSISRVIFEKVRYTAGTLVRRAFAMALSAVIFFLAFAPVVNCHFNGFFASADTERTMTVSMEAAAFGAFVYADEAMDMLDEVHDLNKQETTDYLKEVLDSVYSLSHRDGDTYAAMLLNSNMLSHLLAASGLHKAAFLFTLIPVMLFGMMVFALLIMQANFSFFVYGANDAKRALLSKIMMLAFASLALVLVITFLVCASLTYKHYLDGQYKTLISAAFVILMIVGVGAACIPVKAHLFSSASTYPETLPPENKTESDNLDEF